MSRCSDNRRAAARALGTAIALSTLLSACSDIYYDRRETIAFGGGDAVATNRIVQTIDPWPPYAADRRLTYNGAAVENGIARYRTGRVIQPRGTTTSASQFVQQQPDPQPPPAVPTLPGLLAPSGVK
jgi:hypothetical protein